MMRYLLLFFSLFTAAEARLNDHVTGTDIGERRLIVKGEDVETSDVKLTDQAAADIDIDERRLIIDGEPADTTEFPFFVTIYNENNREQCGGTLIDPEFVLTAAHCTTDKDDDASYDDESSTDDYDPTWVYFGAPNFNSVKQSMIKKRVKKTIRHPVYNRSNGTHYDVALLQIDPVLFEKNVSEDHSFELDINNPPNNDTTYYLSDSTDEVIFSVNTHLKMTKKLHFIFVMDVPKRIVDNEHEKKFFRKFYEELRSNDETNEYVKKVSLVKFNTFDATIYHSDTSDILHLIYSTSSSELNPCCNCALKKIKYLVHSERELENIILFPDGWCNNYDIDEHDKKEDLVYVKDTLWGNTFCQEYTVGSASYHFLSLDEAYISYENPKASSWTLDDGSLFPSKVPFQDIQWDRDNNTFRGSIYWLKDYNATMHDGYSKFEYEMKFDSSFTSIISGYLKRFNIFERIIPTYSFGGEGLTLTYINAHLKDWYDDNDIYSSTNISTYFNQEGIVSLRLQNMIKNVLFKDQCIENIDGNGCINSYPNEAPEQATSTPNNAESTCKDMTNHEGVWTVGGRSCADWELYEDHHFFCEINEYGYLLKEICCFCGGGMRSRSSNSHYMKNLKEMGAIIHRVAKSCAGCQEDKVTTCIEVRDPDNLPDIFKSFLSQLEFKIDKIDNVYSKHLRSNANQVGFIGKHERKFYSGVLAKGRYELCVRATAINLQQVEDCRKFKIDFAKGKNEYPNPFLLKYAEINKDGKIIEYITKIGDDVTVIGLGCLDTTCENYADELRKVNLSITSEEDCKNTYSQIDTPSTICAGQDGPGDWKGDSGGPLMIPWDDSYLQIGVVSQGNPDEDGIYTDTSAMYNWIRKTICTHIVHDDCNPDDFPSNDKIVLSLPRSHNRDSLADTFLALGISLALSAGGLMICEMLS